MQIINIIPDFVALYERTEGFRSDILSDGEFEIDWSWFIDRREEFALI